MEVGTTPDGGRSTFSEIITLKNNVLYPDNNVNSDPSLCTFLGRTTNRDVRTGCTPGDGRSPGSRKFTKDNGFSPNNINFPGS